MIKILSDKYLSNLLSTEQQLLLKKYPFYYSHWLSDTTNPKIAAYKRTYKNIINALLK